MIDGSGRGGLLVRNLGDPGLELGAVGAALTHWWEPLSGAGPRLRG